MQGILKILIVDDSITYRSILASVLNTISNVSVIATAANGKSALVKLSQNEIDLVLLDIEMPEMNGLETLQAISEKYPHIGVVMVSGISRHSADITIQALEAGAIDFISKPDHEEIETNIESLRKRLIPIFKNFENNRSTSKNNSAPTTNADFGAKPKATPSYKPGKVDVIVIGVSTGGPNALNEFIPKLPGDLGTPILLVQHMPAVFTASLASSLDKKSALKVKEAEAGELIHSNTVYIAPGGKHMLIRAQRIDLTDDPPENSCRPAVDVLFRSVAQAYGSRILAVIMTGMGNDGAEGVRSIKNKPGNYCITQSAESCIVYGMPRAVDQLGLSDENVPLDELAERIVSLAKPLASYKA
ncbi:MAG: chemotaxis response regulator protein-glutamate methylesterase [Candidatus Melainabacteria bacterium]|nr:chemotaxis response regulator protein-glutamate methylesterase [Candidatus Melainabacteria bacterium]